MTHEREADEEWRQARREVLLHQITRQRPAKLKHTGELHPDVAAWGKRLVAGEAGSLLLGGPTGTGTGNGCGTGTGNCPRAAEAARKNATQ